MIKREASSVNHFLNYLITYFAIAFSGIPFFDENRVARAVFLVVIASIFVFRNRKIDFKIILLIIVFMLIEVMQISIWGGRAFTIITSLSFLIILPYLVHKVVGIKFLKYYLNIIYVYAIISLFFWAASNYIQEFHDFTYTIAALLKPYTPHKITESFILYTYENSMELGLYRNPGPFHEPGAFGVFLVLAIVINYIINKKIMDKKNIIFIIAAATTFSTATYISILVLFLSLNLFMVKKQRLVSIILFALLFIISFNLYKNIDFLGAKIEEQYEEQTEASLTTPTSGRILGARKAIVAISRYPFTGKGLIAFTQSDPSEPDAAGYGWITWVSKIGLPLGIIYILFFYRSLKAYCQLHSTSVKFAIIAFISLLIVLIGQKHFNTIIFFMIFLTSFIYKILPHHRYNKARIGNV